MADQINESSLSEVSICNQALGWIGGNFITSLDQNSVEAELCRNNYPFLRDAVLESGRWTFATVKASSTTANRDGWGQKYLHDRPLEWLSVYRVFNDVSNPANLVTSPNWKMEGGKVAAVDSTIYMWGIKRITDTGKFSLAFTQALAARIAMDLAMPISDSKEMFGLMAQIYGAKMDEAKALDGMQGTNEQVRSNKYVDARASRGFGGAPSQW